jgi:methionine-rich copper-binding protein CopC
MKSRLAAAIVMAAALMLVVSTLVLGHAELESSDPADGATIKTPYTLTATFGEEITPNGSSIVVQDSTGAQVANGTVSPSDSKQMTIDLPVLPDGQYTVLWVSVTADDNGVLRGTYHFNISANGSSASTVPATVSPSAARGQSTGSGGDLLIPLVVVVILVAAIAGYFLYRSRR